jgi:hypothetical protein
VAADSAAFPALAGVEQKVRDLTYRDGQIRAADRFRCTFPDPVIIRGSEKTVQTLQDLPPEAFRPCGVDRVFIAGPCVDLPARIRHRLQRPGTAEAHGAAIGRAAAEAAHNAPEPAPNHIGRPHACEQQAGEPDVREVLCGLRPTSQPARIMRQEPREVPIAGEYDVVVVGGGTSGACAALGAARRGARVLVVEVQPALGGTGTLGLIGKPYRGRNVGFGKEVPFPDADHNLEYKMEWFRRTLRDAGVDIWFGALGCGAIVQGARLRGIVVSTECGRMGVRAGCVIDATGNADIARAAGAQTMYGGNEEDIALQGSGLPMRPLTRNYVNTDYLLVDEADAVDVTRAFLGSLTAMRSTVFDVAAFIQTRERRRVIADHVITYLDQIAGRTYPDSVVLSGSDYDSHGYPSHAFFALIPHDAGSLKANHPAPGGTCFTPFRCLLPKGVDGILVAGLGIGMERDASAMVRMQHDMHNQGYAAGVAAAMACASGIAPRDIDVRSLQKHLVEIGNLPREVLEHRDSFPLPEREVAAAAARLADFRRENLDTVARALAIVLSHPDAARPHLVKAYENAAEECRLTYAKILGVMGEDRVVPVLARALDNVDAWDDKILQGVMAEYAHLPTPVDALILALGYTESPAALPPLLRKLETLDASVTLSHHRSLALALERIGSPDAARPLAALLAKPGMSGHAMTKLEPLYDRQRHRRRRTEPLREIVLARALIHCGDWCSLGRTILESYRNDLRGLFAGHAAAVLNGR